MIFLLTILPDPQEPRCVQSPVPSYVSKFEKYFNESYLPILVSEFLNREDMIELSKLTKKYYDA